MSRTRGKWKKNFISHFGIYANSLLMNMGNCTIRNTNNEISTEDLCLQWNTLKHKDTLFKGVAISKLGYNLIHIWRLSENAVKLYKINANLILLKNKNNCIYSGSVFSQSHECVCVNYLISLHLIISYKMCLVAQVGSFFLGLFCCSVKHLNVKENRHCRKRFHKYLTLIQN